MATETILAAAGKESGSEDADHGNSPKRMAPKILSRHGMITPLHVPSLFFPPVAAAASGSLMLLAVLAREDRPKPPSEYPALLNSPADMLPLPFKDIVDVVEIPVSARVSATMKEQQEI